MTFSSTSRIAETPFAPYATLFADVRVVPEEATRFASVRDDLEAWVETKTCRRIAVGTGTVVSPIAFTALLHDPRGTTRITRLLPAEERYPRRMGVDDQVVVVIAAGRKGRRHVDECYLFRR